MSSAALIPADRVSPPQPTHQTFEVVVPGRPRLSIVIVNYRQWPQTLRLLQQLRSSQAMASGSAEVLIVDNHSPWDRRINRVRRLRGVSLRRWRHNRGYARAVNEGCRLSRGDWFLLLNPDMSVPPGFLDRVTELTPRLLAERPEAGVVGFRLRHDDGSPQLSGGSFPTLGATLAGLVWPRARRKYRSLPANRPAQADWLTGCCLLIRRDCFTQLGGFDPDFFLYYEDVDFCRRARDHGWSVWHEPSLEVVHHRPLHRRQVPAHIRLFVRHALLTYASRHWPVWQARLLARLVWVEAWLHRFTTKEDKETFRTLAEIASDIRRGNATEARRKLREVARREEERRRASTVDRHPQPNPARPAPRLPEQRDPVRAAEHAGPGR